MDPTFIISAYDPQESDEAPRDYANDPAELHLDAERYAAALRRDWPALTFHDPGRGALSFTLEPEGMRGELWASGHSIRIAPGGALTAAFVRWQRGQIAARYPLYLVWPEERACLPIDDHTTLEGIEEWMQWAIAHFYRPRPVG